MEAFKDELQVLGEDEVEALLRDGFVYGEGAAGAVKEERAWRGEEDCSCGSLSEGDQHDVTGPWPGAAVLPVSLRCGPRPAGQGGSGVSARRVVSKSKRRGRASSTNASLVSFPEEADVQHVSQGTAALSLGAAAAAAAAVAEQTPHGPPSTALSTDRALLHRSALSENATLRVVQQPPPEIRTRTRGENRTFSCAVKLVGDAGGPDARVRVELCYATDQSRVILDNLGGTLVRPVVDSTASFEDLSLSVASPKHGEKEFVLRVSLLGAPPGQAVVSSPFYAYSHKSVLKYRQEVRLRALSHQAAGAGTQLHVVGTPFVKSDRMQAFLRVRVEKLDTQARARLKCEAEELGAALDPSGWASLRLPHLEVFSDSVLFFALPEALQGCAEDVPAFVQVTNDGRNFSNALPLTVQAVDLALAAPSLQTSKRFRSRM
jgi:hypothetical protein